MSINTAKWLSVEQLWNIPRNLIYVLTLQETKAPAKVWVVIHYCLIIIVTAIVLGASQKNDTLFKSYSIKAFLIFAGVDFFCLLYFLWVIIG